MPQINSLVGQRALGPMAVLPVPWLGGPL